MELIFAPYVWMVPAIPLVCFILLLLLRSVLAGRRAAVAGTIGSSLSLLLALFILIEQLPSGSDALTWTFEWLHIGEIVIPLGYELNHLNMLMLIVITVVSLLVHLYSIGYMAKDKRLPTYYAYLALFTSAMLGLVLAPNLIQLFVFWELVGVCSFLLIGFWYEREAAKAAAKKAFMVTRVGDVGLFIAILLLYWHMPNHSLDFSTLAFVFESSSTLAQHGLSLGLATWIGCLLFAGAIGKSGQFPLHVWLPDAMEGPTPVSALIHAATMVAAGVYLVARTFDIFRVSETTMTIVMIIGGFTALFAATIALVQKDLKRVLAYSTISQLGYMMLALGLGSAAAAMFHLFTHAFFKALLFLGAGSIIHAVHKQDIMEMGGLGRKLKVTAWTFAIGMLALSGIPPFSGFWSKEVILSLAWEQQKLWFVVAILTAFLTALYMARMFFLVFTGRSNPDKASPDIHEAPPVMTIPLLVLAVLSLISGFVYTPFAPWLKGWLGVASSEAHGPVWIMIASTLIGLIGLFIGYWRYGPARKPIPTSRTWVYRMLERKYGVDECYQWVIVRPVHAAASVCLALDRFIISGCVRLLERAVMQFGSGWQRIQQGQLQTYGVVSLFGFAVLAVLLFALRRGFW
ncbi:NADH-quinone oxidoreductase subunit L [Paenibacillus aquistagni]|uniref:NADH-quinone oxidoreductase subunit L n=1 Tax=Paenibacillus aquistagni TaxID=1852522 RepID=UPI00145BD60D|nr:NADH-quinone oxidoreductase subunit L [Paenibacillus aquistagni]NMM54349.1 NADH-quinone oxidoreductase subunit L [Paenibacillus aquistagni]